MNSTLQQLFMIPAFSKELMELEDTTLKKGDYDNDVLLQLKVFPFQTYEHSYFKRLFYKMIYTEKEFISPRKFCRSFKDLEGRPTNVREQKDAFEFVSLLFDRLEEQLKPTRQNTFVKDLFGGSFSNELTCTGCPHKYEREEPFLSVNLVVKGSYSVQESLMSLVEEQDLSGENAYLCEKCNKKVNATKRASFKKTPDHLIFVLNRFEYDFNKNVRIKINDTYEFTTELDLTQFTQNYLKKSSQYSNLMTSQDLGQIKPEVTDKEAYKYELNGVVIHTGSADSGHYYSIIKTPPTESNDKSTWLEFNDTHVSEFDIENLPDVAYGGNE